MAISKQLREDAAGWAFVLPAFVFLFLFMIYPIVHTFILSFEKLNFVYDKKPVFVGLRNFAGILEDSSFQAAIRNTLYFALGYIPFIFVLGFSVGYLFFRADLFAGRVAKMLLFLPMVIPISMSCFMYLFILNPQYGLVNSFLKDTLGLSAWTRDWMNNPRTALNVILFVTIWNNVGFVGLLFMAGIQGIPESLIEAATIDGATPRQRILRIVLPNLRSTYLIVGMLTIITALKLFAQVVAMTGGGDANRAGGPGTATLTMYVATYKAAFVNYDMGVASAMGYFMALVIVAFFGLNFLINRAERA
jgi:multiple sugar transport system permease protein